VVLVTGMGRCKTNTKFHSENLKRERPLVRPAVDSRILKLILKK